MKKLVLKKWVKDFVAISVIGIVIVSTMFFMASYVERTENAVNSKIEGVEIDR